MPSISLSFSSPDPIESYILYHSVILSNLFANKLDIVMIANGTPPHFFKIFSDTSIIFPGHLSSVLNIPLKNSILEFSWLSGWSLYDPPIRSATSLLRVVVSIQPPKLLSSRAYLIIFHASISHISSMTMKYLWTC